LNASTVTKAVARWMVGAAMLLAIGKRGDSPIILVFDGDIIAEESSKVFDRVLRDSAWQLALDESYHRRLLPVPSWFKRRTQRGYNYEELPRLLQEVDSVIIPIRCISVTRCHYDQECIITEHRDDTIEEWEKAWLTYTLTRFQTVPPLPPGHIIGTGYVIPMPF
jgi:hypothetical protein